MNFIRKFDPKTSIKNKILKTRSKNLTASLWITWGAENKKPIKTICCKKAELQVPKTPPPTLWKSSIHAGSAHITCRKTVRMCPTWRLIHFRFLAHSLTNVRSLGLRRARPPQSYGKPTASPDDNQKSILRPLERAQARFFVSGVSGITLATFNASESVSPRHG